MFNSMVLKVVICNLYMVVDEIVKYYVVDCSKLYVIYNGVDNIVFYFGLSVEFCV